jgi:hypothetical protein
VGACGRGHRRGARREQRRVAAWRAATWRTHDARHGFGTRTGQRCVWPVTQPWFGAAARSALAAARRGRQAMCQPVHGLQW